MALKHHFIQKIAELKGHIDKLNKTFAEIYNNKELEIKQKEKELEEWRNQLEVCRQEKKQIEKEIKDKVAELEKSELSNTEKQEKINKLLTEHSEELETVDKLLEDERTQYRSIRDKLIERLCQPCSVCPEKERDKKHLRQKIIYSFMITGLLVILFFVFHIWFIRWAWRKERKRNLCPKQKSCRCS